LDAQLAVEIENLREKLAATLAQNNEFERGAEEGRTENERLATENLQNQDLTHANNEFISVKYELTGQNHELA
jgi:hypothetical protein